VHIPDGFVSPPVAATAFAVSAAAVALSSKAASHRLEGKEVALTGVTAAFIFAAQMLNFPVLAGTSGHFLGATLAAVLLGPAMGILVMTLVVVVQCLGFADGGLSALGANVLNMGVVGVLAGWLSWRVISGDGSSRARMLVGAAAGAWLSVVLASAACSTELALSGTVPLVPSLAAMVTVHALIGAGEAAISVAALALLLTSRPDLVPGTRRAEGAAV